MPGSSLLLAQSSHALHRRILSSVLRQNARPVAHRRHSQVPVGYCQFPKEIIRPPRSVAERVYTDIRRWTVMQRGGHFAAMEQTDEVRQFFRSLWIS